MALKPLAKLAELLDQYQIVAHKTRRSFLVDLTTALIRGRSVVFSELADKMEKDIKAESIERRIQDFFQKVDFDYQTLLVLLICFVPHEKVVLSIDRTEWDRGTHQYNILCIVASVGKMAVPLYFEMLDNKSGNSNTDDRIKVLRRIITTLGVERIEVLTMDREFIGHHWLKWLKEQGVAFCLRVPKSHLIRTLEGENIKAENILESSRGQTLIQDAIVDGVVVNVSISLGKDGKLLYLIGTIPAAQLKPTYRKRWPIEVFFQATKGRGFNMEQTGLRNSNKLRKLFAIVSLAYAVCWAVGLQRAAQQPAKIKKHGYPQYSVFRRGLNFVRDALKRKIDNWFDPIFELIQRRRHLRPPKTVG